MNGREPETGRTALHYAANDIGITRALLSAGADPNIADHEGLTPIFEAVNAGKADVFQVLKAAGADPSRTAWSGETLLMFAVKGRNDRIFDTVLRETGLIDAQSNSGLTALHLAAAEGELPMVNALLAAGADPTLRDRRGLSPAEHAGMVGNSRLQELLNRAETKHTR